VLIVRGQTHTLLHEGSCGVVLQVEQVRAFEVGHGLEALLPHRIFLILNQEKCDRHHRGSGEATLTHGGECDVCRSLDGSVRLNTDDGSHPWLCGVEGSRHVGLIYV
jgi:hypothetical protein